MCPRFNFTSLTPDGFVSLIWHARIYSPVCGVDGKTYGNECVAGCFSVKEKCSGQCPCVKKDCFCPRNFDPVCGDDGQTYENECLARCKDVESKCTLGGSWTRDGPCTCEEVDFSSEDEGKIVQLLTYLSSVFSKIISVLGK